MELGRALQHRTCLTRACAGVACGLQRNCGSGLLRGELLLRLLALELLFEGRLAAPRVASSIFMYLPSDEDVPYFCDIVLHQMLVK